MPDLTLRDMLDRNAKRYPDHPAIICAGQSVTHAQLLQDANRLASAAFKQGLGRQDRIAVLAMNSIEISTVYAACEAHGFIAATISFRLAAPEMRHIVGDGGARILIFESAFTETVADIRDQLPEVEVFVAIGTPPDWAISWDTFIKSGDPEGPPLGRPNPKDLCYLIYTSGTTGKAKGCMLDQAAEVATASIIAAAMQLGQQDRTLLMMPMFHIGAKAIALAQQWVGGTVHLHRTYDPAAIMADIETHRITATHMAPTLIQGLLDAPDIGSKDLSSLRTILYSAAPMPPSLLDRALSAFGPIFQQMYGQTEGIGTLLPVSAHTLSDDPKARERLYSVGHAFIGCEVSIRDDKGRSLAAGDIGEICIRGPVMMQGYWNNTAASLQALREGWLHTGDMGRMDEDGYVHLADRKKDMIVSGGENIYSREVEDALASHPNVSAVAVVGRPDEKWGESVVAVVVLKSGASVSAEDLIVHCRSQIAGYKRPRQIVFVENLPTLASGKVNKVALRASVLEGAIE